MGKLSKSKPGKSAPSQADAGQTSMLNFFSRVPAGQSKLFNQVPPSKSKAVKVNKLSRTANKKAPTSKLRDVKQMLSPEGSRHRNKSTEDNNRSEGTKPSSASNQDDVMNRDEEDIIIIPETPESSTTSTPSSSLPLSRLPAKSPPVNLKYNIPETPPSTKSTSKPRMASKTTQRTFSKQINSNSAERLQISSPPVSSVVKQSNMQGKHPQGVSRDGIVKTNSGHSLKQDAEMADDDDYLSIPETQLSIPETQFPPDKSPNAQNEKNIQEFDKTKMESTVSSTGSKEARMSHSKFDDILTSYQKKIESKVKDQSKKSIDKNQVESDGISGSGHKRRNVFGCHQSEKRKSDQGRLSSNSKQEDPFRSDRKVLTAKRLGSKLSRTYRKVAVGLGKQNQSSNSKSTQEKDTCLDQSDLELLEDCLIDNAVMVAPKEVKSNKPKLKSHKIGPSHLSARKDIINFDDTQEKEVCLDQSDLQLLEDCLIDNAAVVAPKAVKSNKPALKSHKSGPSHHSARKVTTDFDDMDCSVLEELLDNLPEGGERNPQQPTLSSIFKPSKVVTLKSQSQIRPSLTHKINKNKLSHIKLGSQKRSPCRGNSPFAKRVSCDSDLAKPGAHVKSLFQDSKKDNASCVFDSVNMKSKKETEELTSMDDVDMNHAIKEDITMETSQPFTEVRNTDEENQPPPGWEIGPNQKNNNIPETDPSSVSDLLQKTPNRLGRSPSKVPNSAYASPSTDALWDNLNDSFMLAAADMEALDEMEADAMCQSQPVGGSVDSQLSHALKTMSPFKSQGSTQPHVKLSADLNRFVVTAVVHEDWQKTIHLLDLSDHTAKTCLLQGTWFETPLHEGTIVAIHGSFDDQGMCVINQQQHFIIVNPDLLLTGTNVTKSIKCLRRSVLGEKFKGLDKASKPMLLGTTLHEVFDEALAKKNFSADFLRRVVQKTLKKPAFLSDMYSLGLTEKQLLGDAEEYMSTMKHWADRYLQAQPKSTATMEIKFPGQMRAEKCNVCVSGVKDIEETVWSPRWGLKGKVDITAQVKIQRAQPRNPHRTYTVPLELKTGKQTNSIEHRSQVMLYSVMLGDLDDKAANDLGVLLYVKTGEMLAVPAMQMDKRELLHLRNQLAYSLSSPATKTDDNKWVAPSLPEPIQDEFTCSRCNYLTSCAMLTSLDTTCGDRGFVMPKFFTEQLAHLSPAHQDYFSHWYLLCALEHMAGEKRNTTKQIWCKDPWEREQKGDCMSGLVLSSCRHHQQRDCYLVTFSRKPNHKSSAPLDNLPFSLGDRIVVGLEGTRVVTCCIGFLETLSHDQVTITSERALKSQPNGTYRMDKDDGYNSMASNLVNLSRLMEPEQSRLRDLVVDLQKPEFDPTPTIPNSEKTMVDKILSSLNPDQQYAIKRVLRSQQYTLIVGMPGTGKTTTIVGLVRILHACGLSVLLTSYTHSAVDNILLKLCKYGIDFLRLGSKHRIHPDLHKYTEATMLGQVSSVQQLGSVLETKPVVATTCLGAKHKLLTRRMFDVCIVDEASQIGQLVCLGPLYVANRFVLVGDHQQLPPLVQSPAARQLGMDESLFQRLALNRPESIVQLSLQYRMNSAIMEISNTLVYEGRLQCGNDKIAKSKLHLPQWNALQQSLTEKWLYQALDPAINVAFLNMDKVEKHANDAADKATVNHTEAELVMTLVKMLIQGGCEAASIGVIAPYRMQCKLLTGLMGGLQGIEINTVDKYQGRDKEVIIVSFTHTQKGGDLHSGLLLDDMRRLNVAVTRAKHKLILLGSITSLNKIQTMQKLLECLATNNAIYDLQPDAIHSSTR